MSRSSNPAKVAEWRQRLRRFSTSGLTVARFCAKERVSTPTFYQWRKRLAKSPPRKPKPPKAPAFRPVTVVAGDHVVSIQLGSGTRIQVPPENMDALRTVVAELLRADRVCRTGDTSC